METQQIKSFEVIGISVRTTNENGQSGMDIQKLWNKFMSEGIIEKITNKADKSIYSIYADYEKDYTKPYTAIVGCRVADLENIPVGMTGISIPTGSYVKFTAKGNIMQGIVFNEWIKIWNSELPRKYTADFEIYGERAQNPENAEVDIFVAV